MDSFFKSDYERGRDDGRAEAERRAEEGTTMFDHLMDFAMDTFPIVPKYGEGYKDGLNEDE